MFKYAVSLIFQRAELKENYESPRDRIKWSNLTIQKINNFSITRTRNNISIVHKLPRGKRTRNPGKIRGSLMLQAPWSRNYPSCLPLPVPPSALSSSSSSPFFSSLFSFLAPHRIIILTGIQGDNESPSGRLETGSQRGRNWRSSIYIPFQHLPLCNSFPFFYFSLSLLLSLFLSLCLFLSRPLISRRTVQKRKSVKHRDCFTLRIYIELLSFVRSFFRVMFLVERVEDTLVYVLHIFDSNIPRGSVDFRSKKLESLVIMNCAKFCG